MMARRLVLPLVLAAGLVALLPAGGALAGDISGQKASVDAKLAAVQAKLAESRRRASALDAQIGRLSTNIHALESRVGDVSAQLSVLQRDVALHQQRLDKLNQLYRLQTIRFGILRREYHLAVKRLDQRLVDIYKQNDPTTLDVLLAAKSFQDVLDQIDYLGAIAAQDKHVASAVAATKRQVASARTRTRTGAAARQARAGRDPGPCAAGGDPAGAARVEPGPARRRPLEEVARPRCDEGADPAGGRRVPGARLVERRAGGEAQGGRLGHRVLDRHDVDGAGGSGRRAAVHLAGLRPDHEPVRHALGHAASRDRHRRPDGNADSRGRRRQGRLVRLGCPATGTS